MKQFCINSAINFLKKYHNYSDLEIKKLRYGLEGLYLTFSKLIVIFLLALLLGIIKEVFIIMILFNIIRYFGFGFHAEKSFQCLILSIFNFVIIPYIFIHIDNSLFFNLIVSFICVFVFLIFAPADTIKRPLNNKKKRIVRKILTVLTALLYILVMILINKEYYSDLILSSLIIQLIVVNPLTYKLFNQPFNNYKSIN